ncbi:chemotaxis protein CheA [Thermobifida halotolerans]|uniref:Chemotaxis protein CheA n=1 Tax=Thermobifida halotolerans TaxID=483545 RepID=A0A399G631_9ACTN|nr:chemotaxis protein CheA [Thermobifida halotolerans]UOE18281.1 chemotaxis protein CheA [Thermobifida halotolerans]
MLRRLAITVLAATATVVVAAAPASAEPSADEVADALNSSNVYVDPDATDVSPSDADLMSQAAENVDTPVYFVVVPEGEFSSQAELGSFMADVQQDVGDGSYLVFVGDTTAADSTVLSPSDVAAAEQAAQRMSTVPDAAVAFANEAESQADSAAASGVFGMVLLGLLVAAVLGGGFFLYRSKKQREAREARELEEVKKAVNEDVVRLGEDIARLDLDLGKADEATRTDYTHAMDSYDRAKTELETIRRADQIQRVTNALEDGRYHMIATRARLAGDPVPERRAPCFFNPQHGPSVRDVDWAPPGGSVRSVPVCRMCASDVLSGAHPDVRMVETGGRRVPYYDAGPAYAPYAGGYFGMDMMMGMFTGMMIGNMMGSMMGAGMMGAGMAGDYGGDAGGGDGFGGFGGDGGGFGDFGGGGFDGGDFGGFGDF